MSKRLQIIVPDNEYKLALSVTKSKKISMSELVRAGLREVTKKLSEPNKGDRLNHLLGLAVNSGPTGEIDDILEEINKSRNLDDLY